jgi:sec-independent protein translocase protein TatC
MSEIVPKHTTQTSEVLEKMPLIAHLTELRKRLIYVFCFFIVAVMACFYYADDIFMILLRPLKIALGDNIKITYWAPHEAFFTYMNLAVYAGFIISLPIIIIQIWGFIAPALYQREKYIVLPFLSAVPFMFIFGMVVAYYFIMPTALSFFATFQNHAATGTQIIQETRVSDYAKFTLNFLLVFGLTFEFPVLLILSGALGLFNAGHLRTFRSYAVLLMGAFSAIASPPDAMSMIVMLGALWIMYELSIIVIGFLNPTTQDKTE